MGIGNLLYVQSSGFQTGIASLEKLVSQLYYIWKTVLPVGLLISSLRFSYLQTANWVLSLLIPSPTNKVIIEIAEATALLL